MLVRLANCCTPVPGDDIIGFVTRGRGVSVHRADCANAVSLMSDHATRLIEVDWDGERSGAMFRAGVEVVALDRSKLLRDVANALSDHHVNIVACDTPTGSDRVAKMRFEFEIADPVHLSAVLRTIKSIDAVYDAYRLVPGAARSPEPSKRCRYTSGRVPVALIQSFVGCLMDAALRWLDARRGSSRNAGTCRRADRDRTGTGECAPWRPLGW